MSVKVMGKVWELDLPANEKFVLLALADHADHDGNNVFPGLELIAFKTGYTTQQVRRIERKLEARKILIAVNRKPGKKIVYRIDADAGIMRERLHTIKMSPPDPLHFDTSTPYISSTESSGINHQLEPSSIVPDGTADQGSDKKTVPATLMNPMKDAIAAAFGYDWKTMTKTEIGLVQKAARELCLAEVNPAEIAALYTYCKAQFTTFKAGALAGNVSEWRKSKPAAPKPSNFDLSKWNMKDPVIGVEGENS